MRRIIAICIALAAVTAAVYWPVFGNDFVCYDDPSYVTENQHVLKGLNWDDAQWAFETDHAGNWHPLTWLSHMLDVTVFETKPAGHHFTNLLFHTLNLLLLFLLLNKMTGAVWRSAAVAALFALHPLHVESVAWVAERKDVLSTFFMLLSLLAYTGYARKTQAATSSWLTQVYYFLTALFFMCGLMSKPMLVTLPCVLLLLDFWPLQRVQLAALGDQSATVKKVILEKLPLFVLSGLSCVVTFFFQRGAGAVNSLETMPIELRISNALISYVRYLGKMFWPGGLSVFYPLPKEWPLGLTLGAAVILIGITALVVWRIKQEPYLVVGWLWYLGTLVPVVGLVQVGQQSIADRYTYIPLIGIFIMIVWALAQVPLRWPAARPWLAAGSAAVLVACAIGTWRQLALWRDSRTLFEHALAVTTDNAVAHNNLGVLLLNDGNIKDAEPHFVEAIRIHPAFSDALANLGLCRAHQGRDDEAIDLFERSLKDRQIPVAHYNLANLLMKQNKLTEAEEHYKAAVSLKPDLGDAWNNLGVLHGKEGRTEEAAKDYAMALKFKPDNANAHLTLGATLAKENRFDEAIAEFKIALRADTNNPDAYFNLASALQAKGNFAAAAAGFAEVCRLKPDDLEAHKALGFNLLYQGKLAEAVPQFEQVLRTAPDAGANYYLGLAYDGQGQAQPALAHYREAVRLNPSSPIYLNDLAWLLATSSDDTVRNGTEAIRVAQEAIRVSGGKEARFWGTLDAAYAEAGRFDDAISTATKVREMAIAAHQSKLADAADQRLALYQNHQPCRR